VEKALILRRELDAQCRSQRAEAECAQVLVEVARASASMLAASASRAM
jgi:hypothetical protein